MGIHIRAACLALLSLSLCSLVQAGQAEEIHKILKTNVCLSCHGINKKIVGPSYKDIAAKYQGNADYSAMLSLHIQEGSAGVWGLIPMPAQTQVSQEHIKQIVDWLIAGAPD